MFTTEVILTHLFNIKNYVFHFIIGLILFVGFLKTYIYFTPYDELELIKKGNTAVAWVLGGTILGYSINLAFAILYSYSPLQLFLYGIFSGLLQLISYKIAEKMLSKLHSEIRDNNNIAAGMLFGAFAVCLGILNGASAY